jgi:hypothetical protein
MATLSGVWFFGILPVVIGLGVPVVSLRAMRRKLSVAQVLLTIVNVSLCAVSLWTLIRMFLDGAGATYLPHYALALTIPLAVLQWHLARAK